MIKMGTSTRLIRVNQSLRVIYLFSDLYTFDTTVETAKETYELVCEAYCSIFERLGLDYIKGKAVTERLML